MTGDKREKERKNWLLIQDCLKIQVPSESGLPIASQISIFWGKGNTIKLKM